MLHIIESIEKWFHARSESITIITGAMTGALWKSNLVQIVDDLCSLQNIEDLLKVAIKAFIGGLVALSIKESCNWVKGCIRKTRLKNLNKKP